MRSTARLNSSSILTAIYDDDSSTLELIFAEGSRYEYFMVPRSVFDELSQASSAGKYFADRIRKRFRNRRLPREAGRDAAEES